jgi:hypothetical protein
VVADRRSRGGGVVRAPLRTTEDIDLIGLGDRLSAVDLGDCLALVEHCARSGEAIDRARVRARLDALPHTADASLVERRARLRDVLAG